ncbi:MAG: hypothetical protein K2K00_03975 [Muribaculaceae bacterium]|nr:hypothetical protein [Muribaculaceae bacterium]
METEKNSQMLKNSLMERIARFWDESAEELDDDDNDSDDKTLSLTLALSPGENARICSAELNHNNSITVKIRLSPHTQIDQTEE